MVSDTIVIFQVFSRQEMLNRVWGKSYALEEHTLDVHIHSLRQKIEQNPATPTFLLTVRDVGYMLRKGSRVTVNVGSHRHRR
jgi:DNA-binding response OmpR family regulator